MYALQKKKDWLSSSINAQKIKSKIANKEKLSQSKVLGILVEEDLTGDMDYILNILIIK